MRPSQLDVRRREGASMLFAGLSSGLILIGGGRYGASC
jgi:hypothetical protein